MIEPTDPLILDSGNRTLYADPLMINNYPFDRNISFRFADPLFGPLYYRGLNNPQGEPKVLGFGQGGQPQLLDTRMPSEHQMTNKAFITNEPMILNSQINFAPNTLYPSKSNPPGMWGRSDENLVVTNTFGRSLGDQAVTYAGPRRRLPGILASNSSG